MTDYTNSPNKRLVKLAIIAGCFDAETAKKAGRKELIRALQAKEKLARRRGN